MHKSSNHEKFLQNITELPKLSSDFWSSTSAPQSARIMGVYQHSRLCGLYERIHISNGYKEQDRQYFQHSWNSLLGCSSHFLPEIKIFLSFNSALTLGSEFLNWLYVWNIYPYCLWLASNYFQLCKTLLYDYSTIFYLVSWKWNFRQLGVNKTVSIKSSLNISLDTYIHKFLLGIHLRMEVWSHVTCAFFYGFSKVLH